MTGKPLKEFSLPSKRLGENDRIIKRTIEGLKKDNIPFKGFLFIGLMNVNGDPFVIVYNNFPYLMSNLKNYQL